MSKKEIIPANAPADLAPAEFTKNPANVLVQALDTVSEESFELDGKTIKEKPLVSAHAKITLLNVARKISDKATSIVLAKITPDDVKRIGCKDVVQFASKAFGKDLSDDQIRDYIRVGKIFGNLTVDGYKWKDAIPQDVTVTNLRDCIPLVFKDAKTKDEKDVYKLSDTELNKLYDKFVTEYVEREKDSIPLQATNKYLREWKAKDAKSEKEKANTIPSTATPIDNKPADNAPADNKPTDNKPADNAPADNKPADNAPADNKPADTRKENFTIALNEGLAIYRDNADIEKAILDLLDLIEKANA